MGGWGYNIDVS